MVNIGEDTIIITYISKGKQETKTIQYLNDIHKLNMNETIVITKMIIGKNLSCYGRIVSTINNQNVMNYQHFGAGSYDFKTPIVFLTFHLSKGNVAPSL